MKTNRENFILILPKDLNKSTPLVGTEVFEQTSPEAAPCTKNRSGHAKLGQAIPHSGKIISYLIVFCVGGSKGSTVL